MIIDEIKKRNIQAIKERDMNARAILGIVINKFMLQNVDKRSKGEEVSDIDMIAILQKTCKELDDEMSNYEKVGNTEQIELLNIQKNIVSEFLPQMMSESEIKSVIIGMEDKSIPNVMKHFKANYAGKCDMGLVSKVLRSL